VSLGWAIVKVSLLPAILRFQTLCAEPRLSLFVAETIALVLAGSMFVMWAWELITGAVLVMGITVINIVAALPKSLGDLAQTGGPGRLRRARNRSFT